MRGRDVAGHVEVAGQSSPLWRGEADNTWVPFLQALEGRGGRPGRPFGFRNPADIQAEGQIVENSPFE